MSEESKAEANKTPIAKPTRAPNKRAKKAPKIDSSQAKPKPLEQPVALEIITEKAVESRDPDAAKPDAKRKNRRRRGKVKSSEADQPDGKTSQESSTQNQQLKKSSKLIDPKKAAKKAWKIYLAEVSEEGVALITDNDARELSRRCFRLAEIFCEEQERRN